jgi:hypothetical protein
MRANLIVLAIVLVSGSLSLPNDPSRPATLSVNGCCGAVGA